MCLLFKAGETFCIYESESVVTQSCPTLSDPVDCSLPGSSVHGILQARILEWIAIPFSRGSSRPRNRTWVSLIVGRLPCEPQRKSSISIAFLKWCLMNPGWLPLASHCWKALCFQLCRQERASGRCICSVALDQKSTHLPPALINKSPCQGARGLAKCSSAVCSGKYNSLVNTCTIFAPFQLYLLWLLVYFDLFLILHLFPYF